jgi:broad specificity phosphatase PhoE
MPMIRFITHPEVVIDLGVPVPEWPLSAEGLRRTRLMREQPWLAKTRTLFTSAERKARDMADLLGARLGLTPQILESLGENDRSATGYLPKVEFELVADAFFAAPNRSVRGWERACDAQRRIVAAVEQVIATAAPEGDVAIIAHGGVGALLLCHLKGVPISRAEDQPGGGGGNLFAFDAQDRALHHGWRPIEA